MDESVQEHTAITDVVELTGESLSGMKGITNCFAYKSLNVSDLKALTDTENPMVMIYARDKYLSVSLLLSCDRSIYGKLVEDVGGSYAMSQDNYLVQKLA